MRALKTVLIILLATVMLLIILGLAMGEPSTRVERKATIPASTEWIWPYMSNLRTMHEWGPWRSMDKDQLNTWEGEDGAVGSVQHWRGDTVGVGSQRIVSLEEYRGVTTELRFLEPWESVWQVELWLDSLSEGVQVTWAMEQQNDLMSRVFSVFMDMDRRLGPDLERGLANLKDVVVDNYARHQADLRSRTFRGYLVDRVERPTTIYFGMRARIKWSDMDRHIATTRVAMTTAMEEHGLQAIGPASIVYFDWDEQAQRTDLMPALPIAEEPGQRIPGFDTQVIPASGMRQVEFSGGYDQLMDVHLAIDEMIEMEGATHYGNVIEEYVIGPAQEADTSKWSTRVLYMVR